jgi:hypothetical protein
MSQPFDMPATDLIRELDHRKVDGIDVWLLWNQSADQAVVAVFDAKSGEAFEVPVRDGDRALDVFHHPFAYAAHRRVERRVLEPAAG